MPVPLHFAFCVNDKYAEYIRVPVLGLIGNNRGPVVIHVLSDYLSHDRIEKLRAITDSRENVALDIIIVDDSKLRGLKETWTIYTWYRVLLPELLDENIDRVLYLDADVAVAGNIEQLFHLDMVNKAIAGTIDFQSKSIATYQRCGYEQEKEYICAGVLLMNLDYWRQHRIADKVIRWGRENNDRIQFPDQDAINYICRDTKIILPLKYDIVDGFFHDNYYKQNYAQELKECLDSPAIIHYAGQAPWFVETSKHLLQGVWDKYNKSLRYPVRKKYQSKGLLLLKVIVFRLLHPEKNRSMAI